MKRITAIALALSMAATSGLAQGAEPQQPVGSAEQLGAGGLASGPAIAALAGLLIIVAVASGSDDDDGGSSTTTTN